MTYESSNIVHQKNTIKKFKSYDFIQHIHFKKF